MTDRGIAPIPTRHNGVLYRSRTEARWAVFFSTLEAEATYEPESFSIDGAWYLPDFFCLRWNLYIEVKPENPTPFEMERCARLSQVTGRPVLMVCGSPSTKTGHFFIDGEKWPENAQIIECEGCHTIGIAEGDPVNAHSYGKFYLLQHGNHESRCSSPIYPGGKHVELASSAAANERFGVYPDRHRT